MGLYNQGSDIIEIINEDYTGRKIGKSKVTISDEEGFARIMNSIIDKYALNLEVIRKTAEKDKIDWLKADEEFSF